MNTSQYMDKQIMDLSKSQQSNTDFIDLINPAQENHEEDDDGRKEEIAPSYDFQPIRPPRQQSALDSGGGGGARVWNSADSISASTSPAAVAVRNYSSLDSIEPAKAILEKDHNATHAALVSEIDRTMKKHADNLMHALEGVSARISQLESRSRNLESSVDDLKDIVGNNQGSTDGKLRQLENILREVQSGVQIIRDKQDILEGQLHLAKLQVSKEDHKPEPQSHIQPDSFPHHQPITLSPLSLSLSPPNAPPPAPQQNLQNQYSQNQIPPPPHRDSYYPQETTTQPQQMPQYPPQYPQPPPPHHQLSLSSMNPPQQPPPPPHHQLSLSSMNPPQPPSHRPEDSPYPPPQSYPPSSQQFYNPPLHIYEPPSGRPNSGYSPMNEPAQYPYGEPPSNYIKHHLSSSPPQLPTARILPQALPTSSGVGDGYGSGSGSGSGSGNRVPIDDVVDKVTNMGFSREQVRATVRKLTENGQAVDLNIVLDKLMNDGVEGQPPRGWFGR